MGNATRTITAKTATDAAPAVVVITGKPGEGKAAHVVEHSDLPGMADYLKQNAKPVAKLEWLADELIEAMKQSLVSFFALCEVARDLDKKAVRHVLREKKFEESRISEILRVAHSTPEIWDEYKSKAIGFKLALKKARDADGGDDPGKKRRQSERKRFVDELRRIFEEYMPVAGIPPGYVEPLEMSKEERQKAIPHYEADSFHVELPTIKVHGRQLMLRGLLCVFEKAKK